MTSGSFSSVIVGVAALLASILPKYETAFSSKYPTGTAKLYICNARFYVCNIFSFTLYMAHYMI